jgi:predicted transcriptional regulator
LENKLETKTLLQSESAKESAFVRAIKQKEASRENAVLVRKKPGVETYVSILRAIKMGASYPSMIVLSTKVPWLTVMQCIRTLEQKGLVETAYDSASERVVSKLTSAGNQLLDEN